MTCQQISLVNFQPTKKEQKTKEKKEIEGSNQHVYHAYDEIIGFLTMTKQKSGTLKINILCGFYFPLLAFQCG